jgi:purine-cytosine permease-like protein
VILGAGAKHLTATKSTPPATAAALISFGATVGSDVVSWCTTTPDYGVYHDAKASRYALARYAANQ